MTTIFDSILNTAGIGYNIKGDVIIIATKKELREEETERVKALEKQREASKKIKEAEKKEAEAKEGLIKLITKTVKVNYILNTQATASIAKELKAGKKTLKDLTQLASVLKKMLSSRKGASIEVVDVANTLIITDIPEKVEQIIGVIKELDVPSRQIIIESKITEIDSNYVKELGIQWGGRYKSGDLTLGGSSPNSGIGGTDENFVVDLPAGVQTGSGGAIGLLIGNIDKDFLAMKLSALEDIGKGKVLSSPRIITQDNQKAYIKIGDEIPYQEKTGSGPDATFSVEFKDAAIELEVTPHTVGDEVFIDIVVAKKSPDWSNTILGNPPLKAQALTTKVSVKNGQTFALGGLSQEDESTVTSSVPFFSSIPVLGLMFKNEIKVKTRKDFIIFITPTIIEEKL